MAGTKPVTFVSVFRLLIFLTTTLVISIEPHPRSENSPDETQQVCNPEPNPDNEQYIIGYGSLMQYESKTRTDSGTGESIPVLIKGYRRVWNVQGVIVGYSTTYLGIMKDDDEKASFNGVAFKVSPNKTGSGTALSRMVDRIGGYDKREAWYCRAKVPSQDVISLVKSGSDSDSDSMKISKNADYWIYVTKPEFAAAPNSNYPIVQSYVDIFVSGCLEIEEKFKLANYTDFCVASTSGWSKDWINDRIYPRRPFIYQPKAMKIDAILAKNLPNGFSKIKIEGR